MDVENKACTQCTSKRFPLYHAAMEGHTECCEALCRAGSDVNISTPTGVTPLFVCCQLGHLKMAQVLSMHGASRDFYTQAYQNMAGQRGRRRHRTAEEQVRLSEEQGLSSDGNRMQLLDWLVQSRDFSTPLHHLELLSYERAVALIQAGADIHARCRPDAPSPVDLARVHPDGMVAHLVLRAAKPWSPETHDTYPDATKRYAVSLLWIGVALASQRDSSSRALLDVWIGEVMPAAIDRQSASGRDGNLPVVV